MVGRGVDHKDCRPALRFDCRLADEAGLCVSAPGAKVGGRRIDGDKRRAFGAKPLRQQAQISSAP